MQMEMFPDNPGVGGGRMGQFMGSKTGRFIGSIMKGIGTFGKAAVNRATNMRVADMMLRGTADIAESVNGRVYRNAYLASKRTNLYRPNDPRQSEIRTAQLAGIYKTAKVSGKQAGVSVKNNIVDTYESVGMQGVRKTGGFMGRRAAGMSGAISSPGRRGTFARGTLISGAGVAGLTVGSYKGVASMRLPGPELGSQQGMSFYGPGYFTWAKGPGTGMPANHLSTQGLTQALHRMRHR